MKKLLFALFLLGFALPAHAQPAPAAIFGCIYNATTPTYADKQTPAMQCDINGRLKVVDSSSSGSGGGGSVTQGTSPWVSSISVWGGSTLGAGSAYGVSPGAVTVPGFNAYVTNMVTTTGITAASGAFASGSISSGAVASGAVASGAIASGAVASGAISAGALAAGSGVDGWDLTQGAKADAVCATSTGTCSAIALLKFANTVIATPTKTYGNYREQQLTHAGLVAALSGNTQIVTRAVGTIKVYGLYFSCAQATTAIINNGTGSNSALSGPMPLTTFFLPTSTEPWFTTTGTNSLNLNLGNAGPCNGVVHYIDS